MNRPLEALSAKAIATRESIAAVTSQSERTLLLNTILLASTVSAVTAYILTQCYSVNVLATLTSVPEDCWLDWGMNVGRHCFSDYAMIATMGKGPHPWDSPIVLPPGYESIAIGFPAAGRLTHMFFGLPAYWLGSPRLGLIAYVTALTIAVLSPAIWAARGARGLERLVIFVALGAAAIPAWGVVDRGNSTGFVVPVALVFFVALARQRWGLAAVMVILAAMIKPQFAVLAMVFFVARQWRWGGITIFGIVASNLAAYLLWPRGFPGTITQSAHDILKFNNSFKGLQDPRNVSFARALTLIPDSIKTYQIGKLPEDFLAGPRALLGVAVLAIVLASLLALGRRIPPVVAGIVLLATATLAPSYAAYYYLVFVLPVAALIIREPEGPPGSGLFDQMALRGDRRRAVGVCLSLAAALSIAQIALPGQSFSIPLYGQMGARGVVGSTELVPTTLTWAPFLWLIACAVTILSYARRPVGRAAGDRQSPPAQGIDAAGGITREMSLAESAEEGPVHS